MFDQNPKQLLPREAYIDQAWFEKEQQLLFGKSWTFAGVVPDLKESGDFRVVTAGKSSIIVLLDGNGELRAFHNICQHRGTELLEGNGNCGKSIMCPYHNWVYNLDGRLRGVPAQQECFPDLDKKANGLLPAAVGIFKNLIFVHADAEADFDSWIDRLEDVAWPHNIASQELAEGSQELVYEIKCNWKVFYENAIDGYHLAYLHKNTLGGPLHNENIWEVFGDHLVWWSTEREGVKHRIPKFVEEASKGAGVNVVPDADRPGYGGVFMLFPATLITPNPWGFTVTHMEPVDANNTILRVRNWAPKGWLSYNYKAKDVPGFDPETGTIKSDKWTMPPLETGDFQTEDVWVCEKMQRSLKSPHYQVGALAKGAGAEAPLAFFQQQILNHMKST